MKSIKNFDLNDYKKNSEKLSINNTESMKSISHISDNKI